MRNNTIVIFMLVSLLLAGCGKSPLLNKLENSFQEVSGSIFLSERFPNKALEFTIQWTVAPSLEVLSSFEITTAIPLKENQTLNAYIWMPDMGHGSSPFEKNQVNSNLYNFSEVAFIMPGLWVLHVELIEDNLVVDEWQKSYTL